MAIKVNIQKDWVYFEPEFMDNKACSKKDRVSCMIKYISQADHDKMTDMMIDKQRKGFRTQKGLGYSKAQLSMINAQVKDIKNVSVIDGEEERDIKTMEEMYYIPHLKGLYEEITNALDASNSLTDEERKN